jgi:protein TonB
MQGGDMTSLWKLTPISFPIAGLLLISLLTAASAQNKESSKPELKADKTLMMKWHFGGLPDEAKDIGPAADVAVESMAEPVSMQPPAFPESMREEKLEGIVYIRLLIGKDGAPRRGFVIKAEGGNDDMMKAAIDAVKGWTFKPAKMKGEAIEVWVVVPLKFRLA